MGLGSKMKIIAVEGELDIDIVVRAMQQFGREAEEVTRLINTMNANLKEFKADWEKEKEDFVKSFGD